MHNFRYFLTTLCLAGLLTYSLLTPTQAQLPATPERQRQVTETQAAFLFYRELTAVFQDNCGASMTTNSTLHEACTTLAKMRHTVREEYAKLCREGNLPPTPIKDMGTMCP